MPDLRILLADDHAVVREGVKALIQAEPDLSLVAEASDGETACRETQRLQPSGQFTAQLIERVAPLLRRAAGGQLALLADDAESKQDDRGCRQENRGQEERDSTRTPTLIR